jgi:6,7-dimethyl-8-ribityllumazine synthase
VTEPLESGALQELAKQGVSEQNIVQVRVPGAVEIPLAAQALLDKGVDGVVTLGAVIRGETAHFDYVCTSVERACTQLQLEYKRPVGFGVLTTENAEQGLRSSRGEKGNKGIETAQVVLEMIELLRILKIYRFLTPETQRRLSVWKATLKT